jgi:hypothetical protein
MKNLLKVERMASMTLVSPRLPDFFSYPFILILVELCCHPGFRTI